jgi:hypothetical protein
LVIGVAWCDNRRDAGEAAHLPCAVSVAVAAAATVAAPWSGFPRPCLVWADHRLHRRHRLSRQADPAYDLAGTARRQRIERVLAKVASEEKFLADHVNWAEADFEAAIFERHPRALFIGYEATTDAGPYAYALVYDVPDKLLRIRAVLQRETPTTTTPLRSDGWLIESEVKSGEPPPPELPAGELEAF